MRYRINLQTVSENVFEYFTARVTIYSYDNRIRYTLHLGGNRRYFRMFHKSVTLSFFFAYMFTYLSLSCALSIVFIDKYQIVERLYDYRKK